MLIKAGVDISRLRRPIRKILNTLDKIYREFGYELVITSTYEGNHSPSSLHYANLAIDIRVPKKDRAKIYEKIRNTLSKDYDVVNEETHIHIEYDPKDKEI